jgi:hypothetical protein
MIATCGSFLLYPRNGVYFYIRNKTRSGKFTYGIIWRYSPLRWWLQNFSSFTLKMEGWSAIWLCLKLGHPWKTSYCNHL